MPSAKIAHLLLVHQSPDQVARLVDRLQHRDAEIFIHVDKKADIAEFKARLPPTAQIHYIRKRTSIRWGAFSMVRATLSAFREIIDHAKDFDFINLKSGSDYVLKPADLFHAYLSEHLGKSFMEVHGPGSPWLNEAYTRVSTYQLIDYGFKGKYVLQRILKHVVSRRKLPFGMALSGGSQWFTMSTAHIRYCLEFVRQHPRFARFFKHTWIPDELFFHTILINSPYFGDIINDNLVYVDWSENRFNPKVITADDLSRLIESGKFFARKFDNKLDDNVLDLIDLHMGR